MTAAIAHNESALLCESGPASEPGSVSLALAEQLDASAARATGLGQRCEARLPNRTVSGIAEGLDSDGALRLRLDDGALERITAGDVFFRSL